jgi:chloride channel 3/4/5
VIMELLHKHHSTSIIFAACEPDVSCITPGTYAIVGAAASLAGVTRLTASIVVIMFELTGALTYVLPIMISVMLSKWIADAVSPKGIYEAWIQLNEYPYLDNKDAAAIPHVSVSNIMTPLSDLKTIDATRAYTIHELRAMLRGSPFKGYPIISSSSARNNIDEPMDRNLEPSQHVLVGYISRTELTFALDQAKKTRKTTAPTSQTEPDGTNCYFRYSSSTASGEALDLRPWTDQTPITLNANSSFQMAVNMFQSMGLRYLLLVEKGSLKGILTKKDVWWLLNASEDAAKTGAFVPAQGFCASRLVTTIKPPRPRQKQKDYCILAAAATFQGLHDASCWQNNPP